MKILTKLVKLYKRAGYFERYGGSVFITIILIFFFYFSISFFIAISNISKVTDNWEEHRCKYHILPFAGLLKRPENTSVSQYTKDNLGYCLNKSMDSSTDALLTPIYFIIMVIMIIFNSVFSIFSYIYVQLEFYISFIILFLKGIRGYIINFIFELQKMILVIKDSIQKTFGIFTGIIYFFISLLLMIVGMIALTYYTGIALIVIITTVVVAGELAIPFIGQILAAITLAFAVAMGIILKPFGGLVDCLLQTPLNCNQSLNLTSNTPSIPQPGSCFHADTRIHMKDNTYKKIKDIHIEDVLHDNSIVNGIIKTKYIDEEFYTIDNKNDKHNENNIIVTGSHLVLHNNKWIYVKDYIYANKIKIAPKFVYCLSTSTNKINIQNHIFHDWNDDHIIPNTINHLYSVKLSTNILDPELVIQDKQVKHLRINDALPNDNTIIGIATFQNKNKFYKINNHYVHKMQKIWHNNIWIPAYKYPGATLTDYSPNLGIGLITIKKVIELDTLKLQDDWDRPT